MQDAISRFAEDGDFEVSVDSLGHRSAFVVAVLLTLPGATATATTPPHIILAPAACDVHRQHAAGEASVWWRDDVLKQCWLEITDRPDIRVDLHGRRPR